nr:glucan endo-1,3-beta-glucosidase 14-like [Tanacetum cinerariifolium]
IKALGHTDVQVRTFETGWPSKGDVDEPEATTGPTFERIRGTMDCIILMVVLFITLVFKDIFLTILLHVKMPSISSGFLFCYLPRYLIHSFVTSCPNEAKACTIELKLGISSEDEKERIYDFIN